MNNININSMLCILFSAIIDTMQTAKRYDFTNEIVTEPAEKAPGLSLHEYVYAEWYNTGWHDACRAIRTAFESACATVNAALEAEICEKPGAVQESDFCEAGRGGVGYRDVRTGKDVCIPDHYHEEAEE